MNSSSFPHKKIAIVQRYIVHYRVPFFRALMKRNPDLDISIFYGSEMPGELSVEVGDINAVRFRNINLNLLGYNLVLQPGVFWHLLINPPDLLVIEGTFGVFTNVLAMLVRKLAQKKTIYWAAGWDNPSVKGWKHKLKTSLIQFMLGLADGAIVYGTAAKDYIIAHGMSSDKIYVAQNTINIEGIIERLAFWQNEGEKIRAKLGLQDKRVIVYVGGISKIKRVDILLKAIEVLSVEWDDLACLIVGKGPQQDELKMYCVERNLRQVIFTGEIIDGVETFISAGDVFVLPGTGGLALNQAMALQKPLIATIADGTEKDLIVPGENGEIVAVDSVESLVSGLRCVLKTRKIAHQMGLRSQEMVLERASLAGMVQQYSDAFKDLLQSEKAK